ncbi:molybdopterin-dependent oxidoreductase [Paenibacillus silvae]|uniref:molybdopterin-dependent oxidoreductase n=1 Tax=Paenibacillus silvae TaxID=1325358 RepID=UPI0011A734E8|nr:MULTISPECIES: molybdopterin-dependent oxidoreductase [Paenibacillus]MCK6075613.1 molybdopterin-dependent oxidoreductase [Paenibacillus silvae]MCK6150000.1 molybdopterin-dependent oxidoreductase [Paenibacillus silvae]MCK6268298.1 molybdopterin-dependent oxidoreductase [Paenibacillus silvae]
MRQWLKSIRKGYGKKLVSIHAWNAWIVVILAVSGLMLIGGFWRETLGIGRVWLKWLHIAVGLAMLAPVVYYLFLASKHWKQLRNKPWQKANTLLVLALLIGWLLSGLVLWQFRLAGPRWSNAALLIHDLLTWVGLPYIIYHSITRTRWLKDPARRTIQTNEAPAHIPGVQHAANSVPVSDKPDIGNTPAAISSSARVESDDSRTSASKLEKPQPVYTRRAFIRSAVGVGLAVTLGPTFVSWIGKNLKFDNSIDSMLENDPNQMIPLPQPSSGSSPPIGGGAEGHFRVYTVTPIPSFSNANWSFRMDGLVERAQIWNWEQFVKLSRTVQISDFHCVTGWSVYKNTWEGIPLKYFLDKAGVKPGAHSVKFYSGDGVYTDAITMEQAQMHDIMVAVMHDGKPIPADLGGPVRLIIPQMYAYKSVKWLNRIEIIDSEHIGYWEERGYDKDAWLPGASQRYPNTSRS